MFYLKAVIIAFAIFIGVMLLCPAKANADIPQPPSQATELLFDNGGVIPEMKKPVVKKETIWTSKVRISGRVRKVNTSTASKPVVEGSKAIYYNYKAYAPYNAPDAVKRVIWAGNKIHSLPYLWGGGHGSWQSSGYDCSGSVSYALHGANLLNTPMDSGSLESWGRSGAGKWITVYANSGHAFMYVAGLRFDTSGADPSRWQDEVVNSSAYVARHPVNL
jgi:hypothetical protein